jgi:uncharacterized protein (TIGR03437 family)
VPPAQSVIVYSSSTAGNGYQATAISEDGGSWLSVTPQTGTVSASSPASTAISVNTTGLAPGVYHGHVNYAFSSDSVRSVNVTLVIQRTPTQTSSVRDPGPRPNALACVPTSMIGTQTGLFDNFAQLAGLPATLGITLIDDCGSPVNGAQVVASFSNKDLPVTMTPVDSASGNYVGTWIPLGVSQQVTVTATETNGVYPTATTAVTGEVRVSNAPVLAANGTVNAFNRLLGAGIAPGEIVEIYGSNLGNQTATASSVPLPANLSGISVLIGGLPAPLFYVSPGQIDAQVPYELVPSKQYQVQVNNNGATTTATTISMVAQAPGLASDAAGTVIAQHNADYSLVTATSPAKPGEYIILYLNGLGTPDQPVATGAAAPGSTLIHPAVPPTVTLNGVTVPVYFAGLTPSAVGLYQIDLQIPANTPDGNLLLSIAQNGAISNIVTIPVHQ